MFRHCKATYRLLAGFLAFILAFLPVSTSFGFTALAASENNELLKHLSLELTWDEEAIDEDTVLSDLERDGVHLLSSRYQSDDLTADLLDGTLQPNKAYRVKVPDIYPKELSGSSLPLKLEETDGNIDLIEALGDQTTIGTVTFRFTASQASNENPNVNQKGSYVEINFSANFISKLKKLAGVGTAAIASDSDAAIKDDSEEHPDEDLDGVVYSSSSKKYYMRVSEELLEISDIFVNFGMDAQVEWKNICKNDTYEAVLPFEGFQDVTLQFKEPVIEKPADITINKTFSSEDKTGASIWKIEVKSTNNAKLPEGTVIRDDYSENSYLVQDSVLITAAGNQTLEEGIDYDIQYLPDDHQVQVSLLKAVRGPLIMTLRTKPEIPLASSSDAAISNKAITITNKSDVQIEDIVKESPQVPHSYPAAMLTKKGGTFKDGIIPWELTVNPGGALIEDDITIVDQLDNDLLGYTGSYTVSPAEYASNVEDTYDETTGELRFIISGPVSQPVKITFTTDYKKNDNGNTVVSNKATAYIADHEFPTPDSSVTIPGGLIISKDAKYDKEEFLIHWTIDFNKKNETQTDVVIIDNLPKGQSYKGKVKLDGLEIYDMETNEVLAHDNLSDSRRTEDLTFQITPPEAVANGGSRFTITFEGTMSKNHKLEVCTRPEGNYTSNGSQLFTNNVTTKVQERTDDLTSGGKISIQVPTVLTKTAAYDKESGTLSWQMTFNEGEYPRTNAVLKDDFSNPQHGAPNFIKDYFNIKDIKIEVRDSMYPYAKAAPAWHTVLDTSDHTFDSSYVSSDAFRLGYLAGTRSELQNVNNGWNSNEIQSEEDVSTLKEELISSGCPEMLLFSFGDINQMFRVTIDTELKPSSGETINPFDGKVFTNRAFLNYDGFSTACNGKWPGNNNGSQIVFSKSSKTSATANSIDWQLNLNNNRVPVDIEIDCDHGLTPGICIMDILPEGMELSGDITYRKNQDAPVTLVKGQTYEVTGEEGKQTLYIHLPLETNGNGSLRLTDSFQVNYATKLLEMEGMVPGKLETYENSAQWSFNQQVIKSTSVKQQLAYLVLSAGAGGTGSAYGSAKITKYKAENETSQQTIFPGVEFTLFKKVDGLEVSIRSGVTDKNGEVEFTGLRKGTDYFIRETGGNGEYQILDHDIPVVLVDKKFETKVVNYKNPVEPPVEPPVNPPVDPPVTPPVDPPVTPPVDPPVTPPVDPPVTPPVDPPVIPPVDPPVTPPVDPPVTPPVDPPVTPPVNPPVDPPVNPPVTPPVEPPVNPPVEPPVTPPTTPGNNNSSNTDSDHTTTIPESPVPLAPLPAADPATPPNLGIPTEDVLIAIPDEDVPLAALPKTDGRNSIIYLLLIQGVAWITLGFLSAKKRKES